MWSVPLTCEWTGLYSHCFRASSPVHTLHTAVIHVESHVLTAIGTHVRLHSCNIWNNTYSEIATHVCFWTEIPLPPSLFQQLHAYCSFLPNWVNQFNFPLHLPLPRSPQVTEEMMDAAQQMRSSAQAAFSEGQSVCLLLSDGRPCTM